MNCFRDNVVSVLGTEVMTLPVSR